MHELEQQDQDQEMNESGSLEGPEDEDIEDEPYVHYIQYLIRSAIARFIPPPILASLSYTRYYVSLFIGEYGAMGCAIIADCQYVRLKKSFSRFRTINLMSQNRPSHGS